MVCHWRYVLGNLFGEVQAVSCLGATHIAQRWDEAGIAYDCTADDAAYATFELKCHQGEKVIAQVNSSWATRVRRDDIGYFRLPTGVQLVEAALQSWRERRWVDLP